METDGPAEASEASWRQLFDNNLVAPFLKNICFRRELYVCWKVEILAGFWSSAR
jgi:hypothetical protein